MPRIVRPYIGALYVALSLVLCVEAGPPATWHLRALGALPILLQLLLFVALTVVGESIVLRGRGEVTQSMATVVHIAVILLVPPPGPLLITLAANLLVEARARRSAVFKSLYNVAHTSLVVGACSLVLAHLQRNAIAALQPGHPLRDAWVLALLVGLYYLLDAGLLVGALSLLERCAPWRVWWQQRFPTLLPELSSGTIGILLAVLWQYNALTVTLLLLPVVTIRVAFAAIVQADARAAALQHVLAAGEDLRLGHSEADLLAPLAAAARAVAGGRSATIYLRPADESGEDDRLARVTIVPDDAMEYGPSHLDAAAVGPGIVQQAGRGGHTVTVPLAGAGLPGTAPAVMGLIALTGVAEALDADQHDALRILARQAAVAVENVRLHEQALARALEDSLTGLHNHRAFQMRLEEETARAGREGAPVAVLMVDLDDFARINNTYGHPAGDAALQAVARTLTQELRRGDIAARYGGDEFAVILPATSLEAATHIAHRLHAAIAAVQIPAHGAVLRVSASLGLAAFPEHGHSRAALVQAADQAAYAAKHAGKGRVGRPEDALLALDHDPAVLAAHLQHANMATVEALAAAVDAKDPYTHGHSQRVSAYAVVLARALGWPEAAVARVRLAGRLHDVGKIGVPDAILTKPAALSPEEYAAIKEHPVIGARMLADVPFLREILPAVRHHHERWDGGGYPDGLAGDAIALDARILAVADSFDAMTSSRTYRMGLPVAEARRRVREGAGAQFDPSIAAVFEQVLALGQLDDLLREAGRLSTGPLQEVAG